MAGVAAPIVWFALLFAAAAGRPGYDHLRQYMTELTAGETAGLIVADTLIVGALLVVFAVGLWTALGRGNMATAVAALVAVKALATIAAGLVQGDVEPLVRTPSGQLHNGLIGVGNIALATACVLAAAKPDQAGPLRGLRAYHVATAALIVAFTVALATLTTAGTARADAPLAAWGGLVQRLSMLVSFGWSAVVGWRLSRLGAPRATSPFPTGT